MSFRFLFEEKIAQKLALVPHCALAGVHAGARAARARSHRDVSGGGRSSRLVVHLPGLLRALPRQHGVQRRSRALLAL